MPMAESMHAAFTLLKVWKLAVWNGLAAALVVVGQEVFTNYAFRCPCVHDLNVAIVVVVFVVPAAVLLCLGFLLQTDTWRAVTGCRPRGAAPPTSTERAAGSSSCCSCRCFWSMLAKALIAPIVWVSAALLTGDYVVCAHSGSTGAGKDLLSEELNVPEVLARIPCPNISLHANISDDIARQIREETNNWLYTVSQVERTVFKEKAEEFIKKHAERDAQKFFRKIEEQCSADGLITNLKAFHETWADISKPEKSSDDTHFSRLQVYTKSMT
ncbi:calcium homeostasis modulator protein 6-like isoform X2 [Lampetra planeri]